MAGPSNPSAENMASYLNLKCDDNAVATTSSDEQKKVEERIDAIWMKEKHGGVTIRDPDILDRQQHINYLRKGLESLSVGMTALDASRPWLVYWIIHSLDLLGVTLTQLEENGCVQLLSRCQNATGGFGGGPGQLSHLAPTYAAVNALAIVGTEEAMNVVNREPLATWLRSLKGANGEWFMHQDGECDVRGAYCAASVARLLNLDLESIFAGTSDWVKACQTFDGGIAAVPGTEAHGGYAFCGLAALDILGEAHKLDLMKLLKWATSRQMRFEGGYQGRPNKLVDGCYSFWVGGVFPLLHKLLGIGNNSLLCNRDALRDYVLYCCQQATGGLRDKPGKPRDYYHTCYCLSGLASSQGLLKDHIIGLDDEELLRNTHIQHNICVDKAMAFREFFVAKGIMRE